MKAKIKTQLCEIPGCKRKAICAWQPKHRADKRIFICPRHREQSDIDNTFLFKLIGLPKPEKVRRLKVVVVSHKPKREGQPAWQKILDGWFKNGKYPVGNFMNKRRWEYWISIGGEKPKGDSRKFDTIVKAVTSGNLSKIKKTKVPVHPLLIHKMTKHQKTKKVRRKK